jgi:hypothetical protein
VTSILGTLRFPEPPAGSFFREALLCAGSFVSPPDPNSGEAAVSDIDAQGAARNREGVRCFTCSPQVTAERCRPGEGLSAAGTLVRQTGFILGQAVYYRAPDFRSSLMTACRELSPLSSTLPM